jgi:hypothetical protein
VEALLRRGIKPPPNALELAIRGRHVHSMRHLIQGEGRAQIGEEELFVLAE